MSSPRQPAKPRQAKGSLIRSIDGIITFFQFLAPKYRSGSGRGRAFGYFFTGPEGQCARAKQRAYLAPPSDSPRARGNLPGWRIPSRSLAAGHKPCTLNPEP
jgi:hypothetical protein